jgi:SnoaL-like domain
MDLETISAHLEIQRALATYCRGVDRGDLELIKSVYHEDGAEINHGGWRGNGREFAQRAVERMDRTGRVGQHHITNVLIYLDGAVAKVESYFLALHPSHNPTDGQIHLFPTGGRYLDRFERRAGVWKIATREVIMDWSQPPLSNTAWAAAAAFLHGARRGDDPSYGFLAK